MPARNEEENLPWLLQDLIKQSYPPGKTEIIVVNDHSEDETARRAETFSRANAHVSLYHLKENTGKKHALCLGIQKATGELVLTTDADCRVQENWIMSFAAFWKKKQPLLIAGPVKMEGKNWFGRAQALEFASLVASGAGAMAIGRPTMANGANLGFSRQFYLESIQDHPLYHQSPSGDDIFLLHQAKKANPKGIHFLKSHAAIAITRPVTNMKNFIRQRARWVSKAKFYTDKDTILSALLVFLMNFFLVLTVGAAFFKPILGIPFLLALSVKFITDFIFLKDYARFSNQKANLGLFLSVAFPYPFYVLGTGLASIFFPARWKGRR